MNRERDQLYNTTYNTRIWVQVNRGRGQLYNTTTLQHKDLGTDELRKGPITYYKLTTQGFGYRWTEEGANYILQHKDLGTDELRKGPIIQYYNTRIWVQVNWGRGQITYCTTQGFGFKCTGEGIVYSMQHNNLGSGALRCGHLPIMQHRDLGYAMQHFDFWYIHTFIVQEYNSMNLGIDVCTKELFWGVGYHGYQAKATIYRSRIRNGLKWKVLINCCRKFMLHMLQWKYIFTLI